MTGEAMRPIISDITQCLELFWTLLCHTGRVTDTRNTKQNNCNIIGTCVMPDWHCHTMFVRGGMGVATTICNQVSLSDIVPDSKVHGANMGPIWDRQDPGGPHVGPMNFAIWGINEMNCVHAAYLNTRQITPEYGQLFLCVIHWKRSSSPLLMTQNI